jgi:hypothetical protein
MLKPTANAFFNAMTDLVDTELPFLYKNLLATARSTVGEDGRYGVALATASSGIAATLLPGGRTAHSTFKIPLRWR